MCVPKSRETHFSEGLLFERRSLARAFESEHREEGMRAFAESRAARRGEE